MTVQVTILVWDVCFILKHSKDAKFMQHSPTESGNTSESAMMWTTLLVTSSVNTSATESGDWSATESGNTSEKGVGVDVGDTDGDGVGE